jgi:hypothetical protein
MNEGDLFASFATQSFLSKKYDKAQEYLSKLAKQQEGKPEEFRIQLNTSTNNFLLGGCIDSKKLLEGNF